ncbi:MAG: hypothetical protein P4M13_07910 [Alphaproteobacteria bacterium]|nr:hypothetical protein [Alphaproteobacteria bacterium]
MKKPRLLLLAAGFLAFGALQPAATPRAFAKDAPAAKSDSKKKGGEDVTGGRFAGDPIYVHISPMVLPVINDAGVEQLVTILFDVQVKDFDATQQMNTNMPRVMDSLMRHLYGGLGEGVLRNGKLVNVNKVKQKAIDAVAEVIGKDNVIDVLVQGIGQRML